MENKYVISGWALSIYGAFNVLGLLLSYSFVVKHFGSIEGMALLALVFLNLFIALGFLALLCGIYLLKNNSGVHKLALPVSIAIMLSIPVGTLVGALYLWQRHENT
jgi:hypothetical protein